MRFSFWIRLLSFRYVRCSWCKFLMHFLAAITICLVILEVNFCSSTSALTFIFVDWSMVNCRALLSYQWWNFFSILWKDMWNVLILIRLMATNSLTTRYRILKVLLWLLALFLLRLVNRAKCKLTSLISSFSYVFLQVISFLKKIKVSMRRRWWRFRRFIVTRWLRCIIIFVPAIIMIFLDFGSKMFIILWNWFSCIYERNSLNYLLFEFRNVWLPS